MHVLKTRNSPYSRSPLVKPVVCKTHHPIHLFLSMVVCEATNPYASAVRDRPRQRFLSGDQDEETAKTMMMHRAQRQGTGDLFR